MVSGNNLGYTVKNYRILAAMLPNFPRKKNGFAVKTLIFMVNSRKNQCFTANPYFLRGKFDNIAARIR